MIDTVKINKPPFTALLPTHQLPLLEYHNGAWRIWMSYDKTKTKGTYLTLSGNGSITRATTDGHSELDVVTITPPCV